ncbi:ZIP family metal transporter [Solemya pervernicosa gill symbiont]|uniref:ZIP family metal transporter n=1 Tax=Solemya pervernicosa gill symbiont TaxID=642797 RepID=UPI0009977097|nr:ZIP family metal transporter [Solemya pervernicosa gill symbiont]
MHSIIAGIALGVDSSTATSIIILVAILSHKGSAAFALGISLVKGQVDQSKAKKTIYLFSLMTPIGIVIGLVMHHYLLQNNQTLLEASFDAIAAGTFLYVATLEVIREEFSGRGKVLLGRFSFLTGGLLVMAALALWL